MKVVQFKRVVKRQVAIDQGKMYELMTCLEETDPEGGFAMLCFALSLLYRSAYEGTNMTVLEFTDNIANQVRGLIDNPPEGFRNEDFQPTPGCDCEVCQEKRERMRRVH